MRFEIYGEGMEEEKVVRLRLVREEDYIILQAVDENGCVKARGNLLFLEEKGFRRAVNIDKMLGLPLDKYGEVRFVNEED